MACSLVRLVGVGKIRSREGRAHLFFRQKNLGNILRNKKKSLPLQHEKSSNCQTKIPQIAKRKYLKLPNENTSNCQIKNIQLIYIQIYKHNI